MNGSSQSIEVGRRPTVDDVHDVERHAEQIGVVRTGDELGVRHVGTLEGLHETMFATNAVEPVLDGAERWPPHHHLATSALDDRQLVLRTARHRAEVGELAFTGNSVGIHPSGERFDVDARVDVLLRCHDAPIPPRD